MSRSVSGVLMAAGLVLAAQARLAEAQLGRATVATAQQDWLGGGVTIVQDFTLLDGSTNSRWDFSSVLGYSVVYEHRRPTGMTVGVEATTAMPLMRYTGGTAADPVNCLAGCDAKGRVRQIMGVIKSGNSNAFHPVYQLAVGTTGFSNFTDQATGARIGPVKTDYDLSYSLGYGVGFGISSSMSVEIVEEMGSLLHQRTGLAAGTGNFPRMSVTRLGGKVGF